MSETEPSTFPCRFCGEPVTTAVEHCPRCGGSRPYEAAPPPLPAADAEAEAESMPLGLHPVSEQKLLVMTVFTLGVYLIWWFYRNWRLRRDVRGAEVWPVPRAVFAPLFAYFLFRDVREEAEAVGMEVHWGAGARAAAFFLIQLAGRLPDPFFIVALAAFLPLLDVQGTINEANARRGSPIPLDSGYSVLNRVGIGVGAVLLLLLVIAALFPELQ